MKIESETDDTADTPQVACTCGMAPQADLPHALHCAWHPARRPTMPSDPPKNAAPFVVERQAPPPSETHKCRLPGFFRRHRLGLRQGAIVRCAECGTRYEWTYQSGWGDDAWWEWSPIATGGRSEAPGCWACEGRSEAATRTGHICDQGFLVAQRATKDAEDESG